MVEEEERPVLDDRSTHRIPELVAHVGILRLRGARGWIDRIKPVASAPKAVIASKPVCVKVQAVAATLGDNVDDRARIAAVLRVEVVGDDSELLRGVRI